MAVARPSASAAPTRPSPANRCQVTAPDAYPWRTYPLSVGPGAAAVAHGSSSVLCDRLDIAHSVASRSGSHPLVRPRLAAQGNVSAAGGRACAPGSQPATLADTIFDAAARQQDQELVGSTSGRMGQPAICWAKRKARHAQGPACTHPPPVPARRSPSRRGRLVPLSHRRCVPGPPCLPSRSGGGSHDTADPAAAGPSRPGYGRVPPVRRANRGHVAGPPAGGPARSGLATRAVARARPAVVSST